MEGYQIALIAVIVIILIVGGGIGIYYATKEETIPQDVTDEQVPLANEENAFFAPAEEPAYADTPADTPAATIVPTTAATIVPTTAATIVPTPAATIVPTPAATPAAVVKEYSKLPEIDAALAEVYGLSSSEQCPSDSCLYGTIGMTGGQCHAFRGSVLGTPGKDEWTPCYVKIGKKARHAFFAPADPCPAGEDCHYGHIQTTGATCRSIGGVMTGNPADDEWTSCHMNIGPSSLLSGSKYVFLPPEKCTPETCYPARVTAQGNSCRALGGKSTMSGNQWGPCEMNLGRIV